MIKKILCFSMVLAILFMFSVPAQAEDSATYSSLFFSSYAVWIDKISPTVLEVSYDLLATGTMDELGISEIKIQRSSDGVNWTTAHTFRRATYPWFVNADTFTYDGATRCTTLSGYYYRAKITFWAKKTGVGTGEYTATTETIYLS